MYAVLGDIEFDVIAYWDGYNQTSGVDYAEHSRIEGKPGLQFIGERLDEVSISLVFHQQYCEPDEELARLKEAMKTHQAMALVYGNGDFRGYFVIVDLKETPQHTGTNGTSIALNAEMTLKEFVGDPANPLLLPGIASTIPGIDALSDALLNPCGMANTLRQAVSYAKKAETAFRTVNDAIDVVKQMKDNPAAALGRLPGVLNGMNNVIAPLTASIPALAAVTAVLPVAASVADGAAAAMEMVDDAKRILNDIRNAEDLPSIISIVKTTMNDAAGTLESVSPQLSELAAAVITRAM